MSSGNYNGKTGAATVTARILLVVEAAALALMCLMLSSILPMKYLGIIIGVCVLVVALQIIMVAGRAKGRSIASIVLSAILCAAAVFVILFMKNFHDNLNKMSEVTRQKNMTITTQTINVYVRKADDIKLLSELSGKNIGILQLQDTKNTELALQQMNEVLEKDVATTGYQGILPLIKGLENSEVDAILVNSAFSNALTEADTKFLKWAELLGTIDITKEISEEEATAETETSTRTTAVKPVSDVTMEPFIIYLTGMDTRTNEIVADLGNSDVNMVVVVNPSTRKILMVNIPRDYYWYLWGDQNYPDKITHAGCYGVDCSVQTMNSLFGIEINYYVKVGFNSVINIVDAIGGVTVNSEYEFSCDGAYFTVGENYLDGYSALQFARERKSLPGGDRARGMNQQEVIRAILSKVTSVEMLPRFSEVLSIFSSNVVTSIPTDDMEKLLKLTLENNLNWEVQSIQVDGTGAWDYCYSLGDANDIMIPDWSTVEAAQAQISSVMNER